MSGLVFVFPAMGTMISIRTVAANDLDERTRRRIVAVVEEWEERFSLYRPESEASVVASRQLPVAQASTRFRRVLDDASRWKVLTSGAFDPVGPDRRIDLNGIVKALVIQAIGVELTAAGHADWCINVGGDVLVSGTQGDGSPWRVGVVDPADRGTLLATVPVTGARRAVATSGYAERGDHVWRSADSDLTQVTVLADDIVTADVLATAILAGGPDTLDRMTELVGVDVLAVRRDGACLATNGFRAA